MRTPRDDTARLQTGQFAILFRKVRQKIERRTLWHSARNLDHAHEVSDVFSLMIDGSGSRCCRIFGRLRPVRMVMKWGSMAPSKRGLNRCAITQWVGLST